MEVLEILETIENFKEYFKERHVTPNSLEVGFWLAAISNGGISFEYVVDTVCKLTEKSINPYTVIRRLQEGFSEEVQCLLWPYFEQAIKEIDRRLEAESTWTLGELLEYGYNSESVKDLMNYVQRKNKLLEKESHEISEHRHRDNWD